MNPKNEWFKLRKSRIYLLFTYYILLLVGGIVFIAFFINDNISTIESIVLKNIFFVAVIFSIIGSSAFYIRKLYKACINSDMTLPNGDTDSIKEIGVMFYFILRPLFAIVFCLLTLFIIKSGISILSEGELNNNRFFYFASIISFMIGYSCGDYIDQIEKIGKRVIEKITDVKL